MNEADLLRALDKLKATMIAVATGGPQIKDVEVEFIRTYREADSALRARGLIDAIPFGSLWEWYGRWKQGDLPTYQSRRDFVNSAFVPIINRVRDRPGTQYEPTGWERVDRTVIDMRNRLAAATTEEQFQGVGLLGRELLISTAQQVFDGSRHQTLDGVAASTTDAKRMLDAYIAVELGGGVNDFVRKHAKAALDLAVQLQHKRTATFRDAAICVEATTSVVNLIAIIAGLRDPQH